MFKEKKKEKVGIQKRKEEKQKERRKGVLSQEFFLEEAFPRVFSEERF